MPRTSGTTSAVRFLLYVIPLTILGGTLEALRVDHPLIPSSLNLLLFFSCAGACAFIKSAYSKAAMIFWVAWFVVGTLSFYSAVGARVSVLANAQPDPNAFGTIYLAFNLATIAGVLFNERLIRAPGSLDREVKRQYRMPSWATILLLFSFPFAYVLSIQIALGFVPMFSGRGFVDTMYSLNYGPLQPFSIIIVVGCVVAGLVSRATLSVPRYYGVVAIAAVPIFLILSAVDGRRVLALMALVSLGLLWIAHSKGGRAWVELTSGGLVGVAFYVFGQLLRTNGSFKLTDPRQLIGAFGVEYIDSAYVVHAYDRGVVHSAGYDWIRSTIASLVNGKLLELIGVNKLEWVAMDSARTFMKLFDVRLGIRVGISTEIWYAFGWLGILVMFVFGVAISRTADAITRQSDIISKAFFLVALGNFVLATMGQSTVIFGVLPTLMYLFLLFIFLDRLPGSTASRLTSAPPSP